MRQADLLAYFLRGQPVIALDEGQDAASFLSIRMGAPDVVEAGRRKLANLNSDYLANLIRNQGRLT
ncbi:MAG: hypothetical protein WKF75_11360 [Singulisphaera sp.]